MTSKLRSTLAIMLATFAVSANAALIDRGNGLIYDSTLNITWLQDANYANRTMNWSEANSWAANLVYGGYSDWRLPTVAGAINNTNSLAVSTFNGTNAGYNVLPGSSELAHLYFVDLGNKSKFDVNGFYRGDPAGVNWGLANTGPFINIQNRYWFATFSGQYGPDGAWGFDTSDGSQGPLAGGNALFAWAVRDGDVASLAAPIPEPETYAMMLAGLGLLGVAARRRKQKSAS